MSHPVTPSSLDRIPRSARWWVGMALALLLTYAVFWVLAKVGGIIAAFLVPVVLGLLLSALLMPLQLLFNHRLAIPRHLSALLTLLVLLGVVATALYYAGHSVVSGLTGVRATVVASLSRIETWLVEGPLKLDASVFDDVFGQIQDWLLTNTGNISSGVIGASGAVTNVAIAGLIALMTCFFILAEGDRLLSASLLVFDDPYRTKLRESLRRGWVTLGTWARTQIIVSAVDAISIGLGAAALGLPFVVPMAVFTFLVCYIPMLGPIISGAVFVAVALATEGFTAALIMLVIVIAVQQVESYVLQPLLMGKAVNLHPLVVVVAVTAGMYLAGIAGALLIVPFLATVNSARQYWVGLDPFPGLDYGGSALLSSQRKLVPSRSGAKLPKKVGSVTPEWLEADHEAVAAAPPKGEF